MSRAPRPTPAHSRAAGQHRTRPEHRSTSRRAHVAQHRAEPEPRLLPGVRALPALSLAVVTGVAALTALEGAAPAPTALHLVADDAGTAPDPSAAPIASPAPPQSAAQPGTAPASTPSRPRHPAHHAARSRRARPHAGGPCTDATWRATLYAPERWIDTHESRLNPRSVNHSSGARGLGQLLPMTYRHVGVRADWDPCHQITAQRRYMTRRYRTWGQAKAFWRRHHWW